MQLEIGLDLDDRSAYYKPVLNFLQQYVKNNNATLHHLKMLDDDVYRSTTFDRNYDVYISTSKANIFTTMQSEKRKLKIYVGNEVFATSNENCYIISNLEDLGNVLTFYNHLQNK